MNVLLNASNLRFGGGYTVAISLINALAPLRPNDFFFVVHPAGSKYNALAEHQNVRLLPVSRNFQHSFGERLRYNHYIFPKWCRDYKIDKVVSLGNIAFPAKGRPHLLYIQIPHIVYPESIAWKRMDWKSFLRNSVMDQAITYYMRYATAYAVQTAVMRARFCKRFDIDATQVAVLPNAAICNKPDSDFIGTMLPDSPGKPLRLLFLSKWYAHKNFECLIPLAEIIRAKKLQVQISLTIEKNESTGAAELLRNIQSAGLNDIVINLGNLFVSQVGGEIMAHDALFLPSLLESYSGVYAEALQYSRPIFTSNYDFATELLGDAAFYFDPLKSENIAEVIAHAIAHPETIAEKIANGKKRYSGMPRWNEIAASFSILIDELN